MKDLINILLESPYGEDAVQLMEELSDCLHSITGNSGKGSFDPEDVCIPRSAFAIARNDRGEAVGCGAIRPIGEGIAEVKRMYSRIPGKGVGKQILKYLEQQALLLGYSALWLETRKINQDAVSFYLSQGYRVIPNYGKYAGKAEAVCFEKRLSTVTLCRG